MAQKILIMTTSGGQLRSGATGWTCEDGDFVVHGEHIGQTRSPHGYYTHATPLAAIGAGWNLIAPPEEFGPSEWEWWFSRHDTPDFHTGAEPDPRADEPIRERLLRKLTRALDLMVRPENGTASLRLFSGESIGLFDRDEIRSLLYEVKSCQERFDRAWRGGQ